MIDYLLIVMFTVNFDYIPLRAQIGYSNQYMTVAHFSASLFGFSNDFLYLGVSLYGQENVFHEYRNGKVKHDGFGWDDSTDFIVRYRNFFSNFIFYFEVKPLRSVPLFLKAEGSFWADERVDTWVESEIISRDPYRFYDYYVCELHPSGYNKLSIGIMPIKIYNEELFIELGTLNVVYPGFTVKEIKTSLNQYFISAGMNYLHKKSGDRLCWEIPLSAGIDVTAIGPFALRRIWNEAYMKEWQMLTIGLLSAVSGAGCGYMQHYVKEQWVKPGDQFWKKILKKGVVGVAAGTLYEFAMIGGYMCVSRDWPHNGDYMARDFGYLFMIKAGCLGHLLTSVVF